MHTIGLIGGIATGKSEVARLLAGHGARVIDADRLVHEVYAPSTPGFAAVLDAFGSEIAAAEGGIDRQKLGALVFADAERMRRLTDIVWPLARSRVEAAKREAAAAGAGVLVIEAALLLEAGWRDLVDQVWLVQADKATVRRRLRDRGLSAAEAETRLSTRGLDRTDEADLVIENDGDLAQLAQRVERAWLTLVDRKLV